MTHSPHSLPIARNVVERLDRHYRRVSLSTAPVLDAAGDLLHAWCATAVEHGADMAGAYPGNEWAERLALVALEIAARAVHAARPATPEQATALLDIVAARLGERGVTTARDVLCVPLPRTESTPAWGASEPRPLAISITLDRGWALVIDQPQGSPIVEIIGRCDESGIDAMLDLATIVNTGAFGNLFRQP